VDKVEVKKGETPVTLESDGVSFKLPAGNVTVTVTFKYVPVKYKVNNTSGTFVNIRKTADSASEDLGDIPNNTIIESMEGSTSSWIKVTYNDGSKDIVGWVGTGNLDKVS
jgi:hypothetical protein